MKELFLNVVAISAAVLFILAFVGAHVSVPWLGKRTLKFLVGAFALVLLRLSVLAVWGD